MYSHNYNMANSIDPMYSNPYTNTVTTTSTYDPMMPGMNDALYNQTVSNGMIPNSNNDERFFWAPFVVGGLAGTALGYGIANNNQINNHPPMYYPMPYPPMYPMPCPNCITNIY